MDFRSSDAIADISEETILHGDIALLEDYHEASQSRPLLETFLQPTEGFMRTFVDNLQSSTVAQREENKMTNYESAWYYRCVPEYMERDYVTPRGQIAEDGFLRVVGRQDSQCMDGPGTTRISLPGSQIPVEKMMLDAQPCSKDIGGTKHGCFVEIESTQTPALRISVAGLNGMSVELTEPEIQTLEGQQHQFRMDQRMLYCVFPPKRQALKEVMKENDRRIVHIVHTWVHELPGTITWRQFCANTLVAQSSQNFLWIIRADSADRYVLRLISQFLKGYFKEPQNVLLVESSHTPTIDFRMPEAIADITEDALVVGHMDDLLDVHMAAKGRTLLETFLQPTDSLAKGFMADLHQSIETEIEERQIQGQRVAENHGAEQEDAWYYRCVPEYIQWSYFTPRGDSSKTGFLRLMDKHHTNCMENPAVTRISFPGAQIKNDMVLAEAQKCLSNRKDGCYVPLVAGTTPAARALIPQSVEKAPVLQLTEKEMVYLGDRHDKLLKLLSKSFAIMSHTLEIMVTEMQMALCEDEQACTSKWASKFGVVHVIHTSLQDPLMFDVWRKFCFALEAQTTTKFLWIIRVGSDEKLMQEVTRPIVKTPLNIIVARSNYTPVVDFRRPEAIYDLTMDKVIVTGVETEMLKYFHESAQSRPLLETFLQPTDALAKMFVMDLQNSTVIQLKENGVQEGQKAWYYRCVSKYIEWTYFTPQGEDSKGGFLKVADPTDVICMKRPGTTRISLPGAEIPSADEPSDAQICSSTTGGMQSGCFVPIGTEEAQTARVVIPDSIQDTAVSISKDELMQLKHGNGLEMNLKEDFSITPIFLTQMRKKIKDIVDSRQKQQEGE
jgi:hypothetical protein